MSEGGQRCSAWCTMLGSTIELLLVAVCEDGCPYRMCSASSSSVHENDPPGQPCSADLQQVMALMRFRAATLASSTNQ